MMRDSKSNGKKPIEEVQAPRPRKYKLERIGRKSTKCKRAEDALLSERNRLISIFEAMADGVYIVNQEYDIEYVNPVLEKDFGSWEGRKCYEYFHDRKESCSWCKNKDVFAGKTVRWEWYSFKNQRTYDLVDTPLKNTDGSISKLEIFRDITERKRAEEALKASELRFRSLIEQTTDAVFCYEYDPPIPTDLSSEKQVKLLYNGLLVECNDVCAKSYGAQRAEEVIGRRLTELFKTTPGSLDKLFTALIDRGYRIVDGEGVEKLEDGTERYYLNNGHGIIEDGKLIRVWGTFRDITERKRAERELKQSMEFLANTINTLDDPFFVKDEEHRWAALNNAACEVMGRPREELIGKSDYDLFAKEQADVFWERDNYVLDTGQTDVNEEKITWHGKSHTISTKKSIFTDSLTGKKFIVGTIRDITERKQAESALRESEKQLSLIYNSTTDIMILFKVEPNGEFNIVTVNDRFMDRFAETGIRKDMVCNTGVKKFFQEVLRLKPEDAAYRLGRCREAANSKETVRFEVVTPLRNGVEIITETTLNPIVDKRRECTHVLAVIKDITERKKAEEALIESEEKFRNLAEQSPNMIFINKRGRVVYANKECEEVMGYKREEFYHPDFDFMTLIAPEFRQLIKTNLGRHMKGEEIKPYEYGLITKGGERLDAIITTKLMKYDGEDSILGTITDITKRKQAQEEIAKLAKFPAEDPNPVLRISKDGTILYANNTSSIVLKTWERKVGERLPKACYTRVEEVFRSGTASTFEFHCHNGQIFDVKLVPIVESGYANAYGLDITERKKAEKEWKKSRDGLIEAQRIAHLGSWEWDIEENKLSWSEEVYHIFGLKHEEFTGDFNGFFSRVHPDDKKLIQKAVEEATLNEKPIDFEHRIVLPDGTERIVYEKGETIYDESGKAVRLAGTIYDITERKQAEERLLEYQEQLKSLASQLSLAEERERRRIATELHDEISQSLFISKMKLEALDKSTSDKKYDDTLDEINNSLGRILAAMRSLTFDLSSPILYEFGFEEAVAEWLNERVEKKYGIATEFEDDGLHKPLDDDIRVLLFRNVRELLINIIKHAHASKVKVSIGKVGGRIHVSVEDDGLGFEPAKAESMITNKEAFGLFSIRERLEHFGGNLDIDSAPGCGCRVTITSPLKREDVNKDKQK
ncbi:MAG: PAS domain S-box protein [Planctomycetota bacterium]|jgi:PAS domain S-box-containing protein